MPNKNRFESVVTISAQSVDHLYSIYKDAVKQKNPTSVIVNADATFGGYLNGNHSFYSGFSMKNSLSTWVKPTKSPVLINHDSYSDPIGRVYKAEFLDIEIPKDLTDVAQVILKSKKIKEFTEAAHKVVDYQRNHPNYEGLCKIGLTYKITDLTAIPKILDERYLNVSSAFRSKSAYCSICGQSYVKDGYCDHRWGATYEDEETGEEKVCFRIAFENYDYDEVSYINFGSFKHAVQTSVEIKDMKNSETEIEIKDSTIHVPDVSLFCSLGDCACVDTKPVDIKPEEDNQEKDSIKEENILEELYKELENSDSKLSKDKKKIRTIFLRKAKEMGIKVNVKDMKDIKAPEKFALLLSDSLQSYEVVKSYLSEDKWLDQTKLEELKDEDFAAPNRMLPMIDEDHKDAIGKIISELNEDEECKADYTFELIKDKVENFCVNCGEEEQEEVKSTDKKDITIGLQKDKIKELTEKIVSVEKELKDSICNELLFVKSMVDKTNYNEESLRKEMDSQDIKTIKARIVDNKGFLKDSAPAAFVEGKGSKVPAEGTDPEKNEDGTVENPVDRNIDAEDGSEKRHKAIDKDYKQTYLVYGKEAAEDYLTTMKLRGYISQDYKVEIKTENKESE